MKGYFRQDGAGHWYLIPKEGLERFGGLLHSLHFTEWQERYQASLKLVEEFAKYRISGGVGDYEVTIHE
jgi:hypothetical protein